MSSKSSPSARRPPRSSLLRVALTGGIACGKSVVAGIFASKGFFVHSADQAARDLVAPGRPAWRKIVRRFGQAILRSDRTIDRARLGAVIFSDPEARRFLDSLLHPLVLAERAKVCREVERRGRHAVFVSEAALTIEAGYARHFDRIVVVRCDDDLRLRRLMERDGIGKEEALRKIGSQMPQAEKVRHADYVIDTSGSLAETVEAAERTAALLLQDAALKRMRTGRPGSRTGGP
jgi:dephospho-CoA kinase